MRVVKFAACLGIPLFLIGCAAMKGKPKGKAEPGAPPPVLTPSMTPVPTVPPQTVTPAAAVPLPTRPVGNPQAEAAKKRGQLVGPVITHIGLARADGQKTEPASVDKDGTPTFVNKIGSGFMIVIEGKPGISNLEVGRRVMSYDANDPKSRPDLDIQTTSDLGDGSVAVCDRRKPNIGGVPGIKPPNFETSKKVAEASNDLACRFEVFTESASACTITKQGDFAFIKPDSQVQYCMVVARAWSFPVGDTTVSVRLQDRDGNPGPIKKMIVRRPAKVEEAPRPQPTSSPTPVRRRP